MIPYRALRFSPWFSTDLLRKRPENILLSLLEKYCCKLFIEKIFARKVLLGAEKLTRHTWIYSFALPEKVLPEKFIVRRILLEKCCRRNLVEKLLRVSLLQKTF